jgi:hypothetical protein
VPVRLKSKLRKLENSIRHLQSEVISWMCLEVE